MNETPMKLLINDTLSISSSECNSQSCDCVSLAVHRYTATSLSVGMCIAYAVQLYWDRNDIMEMALNKRYNIHRIFRITGFVGSSIMSIICVDFYGVFLVWSFGLRWAMCAITVVITWGNLILSYYGLISSSIMFLP